MKKFEEYVEEMLEMGIADGLEPKGFWEEERKLTKEIADLTDKLFESLSPRQIELYNELEDKIIDREHLCEKASFVKGFRLSSIIATGK